MSQNPYLAGNFAPIEDESTAFDLPVTGEIPPELNGRLLRIGPNPIDPNPEVHHWFLGSGMVHGLRLREGRAEWYRSRYVRDDRVVAAKNASYPQFTIRWSGLAEYVPKAARS